MTLSSFFRNEVVVQLRADLAEARQQIDQTRRSGEEAAKLLETQCDHMLGEVEERLHVLFARERELLTAAHTGALRGLQEVINDLRKQVVDTRKERDYFRNRVERLELRLLPEPVTITGERKLVNVEPIAGRPNWQQVQRNHAVAEREKLAKAAEEKEKKGKRIDAPRESPAPAGLPKEQGEEPAGNAGAGRP